MSKSTAATSRIQISEEREALMLAMELGEGGWLLGFSSAFGQKPLRRKIASRDGKALLAQISWAKEKLGLAADSPVASCYEAGRDGFWLHRFLVAYGIENLVVDSASIEVNRKKRRAKTWWPCWIFSHVTEREARSRSGASSTFPRLRTRTGVTCTGS
jgi:hypothetical protein